jgi:murein DD-endopeptidase MepM/ murein hydrolase activator NlpD
MWSLLTDLARRPRQFHTVVVMEADSVEEARQYTVRPSRMAWWWGGSLVGAALCAALLLAFTPLRTLIPGYSAESMRQQAHLNTLRMAALQDSVAVQKRYIQRMQDLLTGRVQAKTAQASTGDRPAGTTAAPPPSEPSPPEPSSRNWQDHNQPAFATDGFTTRVRPASVREGGGLTSLLLPASPPVENGFPTRGFDARSGHYAIDIAVPEGALVHAIGDGYVIMADWTQEGGYTIAVQHADGYLSVYKHNKRLLKRIGDRVRANEAVAVSGNTGEITTGPHLHFELWHHGLAQDPRSYIAGW